MASFKQGATTEKSVINKKKKKAFDKNDEKNSTISYKQRKNSGTNPQLSGQLNKFQLISQLNTVTESMTDWISEWMNNNKSIKEVMFHMHRW